MGIVSCTAPVATEGYPTKSRNVGANAKIRLRIRGYKLLILLVISSYTLQCGVIGVAVQALPSAQAPSENALEAPVGPVEPMARPMVGEAPLPSPLLAPPQEQAAQFQQVISSLRSNNYTIGGQYISDYLFLLPLDSTVFVPTNAAFDALDRNLALGPLLAYHAILQQFSYELLLLFPAGTGFPSLIGNKNSIVITGVAPDDFRVDDVRIVQGNICRSSTAVLQISCHGVDGILNMTLWGQQGASHLPPVASPPSEAPISELTPPLTVESPSAPAPAPKEVSPPAGGAFRAESRCALFSVVLLYLLAAALTV